MDPPPRPLRLAILEADTPLPNTHAKHHGYAGVFAALFARAVAPAPLARYLTITAHDVVGAGAGPGTYPALDAVDAVLISGSRHCAADDGAPWVRALVAFTARALLGAPERAPRVRVVGVCFGHQIVARALGARVAANPRGWEVSVSEVRLRAAGRAVFGGGATLRIHQMHRDIVLGTPPGAECLAESDKCANQGFLLPGRAITVQGHPEFTGEIMPEILDVRHEAGVFDDELYKSGMERASDEHDGVRIAQALLRFMSGQVA